VEYLIMTQRSFCLIAGLLFTLVALAHLWRIVEGWDLMAYGTAIPLWTSWVAVVITGILAFYGLLFGLRK
jgi:hypothetical protein